MGARVFGSLILDMQLLYKVLFIIIIIIFLSSGPSTYMYMSICLFVHVAVCDCIFGK